MRVYVFENGDDDYPAFVVSEHRLDPVDPLHLEFIAEGGGTFVDCVLTREELLATPDGRAALERWESGDDADWDRLRQATKERLGARREAEDAWYQSLPPVERRRYDHERRERVKAVFGLTDTDIAELWPARLRLV
jgi:hypothetical protein